MKSKHLNSSGLAFHSLTPDRCDDFATLFGERGACGGCWCMWWRLAGSAFEKQKGEPNRLAMKEITARSNHGASELVEPRPRRAVAAQPEDLL